MTNWNMMDEFFNNINSIMNNDYYVIYDILQKVWIERNSFIQIVKQNWFLDELERIKYIKTLIETKEKKWLRYENINKILKWYIVKIFNDKNLTWKYKFKLWWWTGLVLNWDINRYSEDIDLFVNEKQINEFKQDLQDLLKLNFTKNKANEWYFTYINEEFKIEILPTNKLNYIIKDWIRFTPLLETVENKLNALKERDEFRDIYDLAILSLENRKIFKQITPAHIKKLKITKWIFDKNKKLLRVFKNEKIDLEIIKSFYKNLNI